MDPLYNTFQEFYILDISVEVHTILFRSFTFLTSV